MRFVQHLKYHEPCFSNIFLLEALCGTSTVSRVEQQVVIAQSHILTIEADAAEVQLGEDLFGRQHRYQPAEEAQKLQSEHELDMLLVQPFDLEKLLERKVIAVRPQKKQRLFEIVLQLLDLEIG